MEKGTSAEHEGRGKVISIQRENREGKEPSAHSLAVTRALKPKIDIALVGKGMRREVLGRSSGRSGGLENERAARA